MQVGLADILVCLADKIEDWLEPQQYWLINRRLAGTPTVLADKAEDWLKPQ
ncbi:hypothetical protein ACTQ5K_18665 [Niallia sp. Sow4_A1]|uniref:hypothetical protein n=1 Tax=unclassified Niallia TaxID=2837522 RepID=UPI003F89A229